MRMELVVTLTVRDAYGTYGMSMLRAHGCLGDV
jgi:hypothetical protein